MTERRSQVLAAGTVAALVIGLSAAAVEAAPRARLSRDLADALQAQRGEARDVILQADQATVDRGGGASRRDHQEVARHGRGPLRQRRLARRDVERRRGRSSLRRHDGPLDDGRDGSGHRRRPGHGGHACGPGLDHGPRRGRGAHRFGRVQPQGAAGPHRRQLRFHGRHGQGPRRAGARDARGRHHRGQRRRLPRRRAGRRRSSA